MILENSGKFWKIFCFLLKFLLKKCYKDRFTYKIYNMTYFLTPNHIWCHIHAKFRGLKSHLITSESHPRVTSGQNSEASHIRVSHPQSHIRRTKSMQSLPGGHPAYATILRSAERSAAQGRRGAEQRGRPRSLRR